LNSLEGVGVTRFEASRRFHGRKDGDVRTIAIINQKGGCGKTTTAINLAAVLALQQRRTLLVDMDPQSHCALGLAVPESQLDCTVGDLLRHGYDGTISLSDATWQISRYLDLLPSNMALAGIEAELNSAPDKDRRLTQVLAIAQDDYEFCIIDCPPSIGLLTFNALRAADEVIVPVETGYFALQGSLRQEATIEMLSRRAQHHVRLSVLATMYDVRTKLAREILAELKRKFEGRLLPVVVNFNSKLKEAASFGQPITEYDPASRGMADFEKLSSWLVANPPAPAQPDEAQTPQPNPALSRAAELVQRARALSQRTASLTADLAADPDMADEGMARPMFTTVSALEQIDAPPRDNGKRSMRLDQKLSKFHGVRITRQGVLFVQPDLAADQVQIAGDFNNWSPSATPMHRNGDLGVWETCVAIPPGRYRYRLVVDGRWVQDRYNDYVESNPFGELNNILEIEAP
jgi:chromosome partitioning protein